MIEQLNIGFELMLIGMGIVFLFLVALIFVVNLMSSIVIRFFPEVPERQTVIPTKSSEANEKSIIAAISAAVHQHRAKHK